MLNKEAEEWEKEKSRSSGRSINWSRSSEGSIRRWKRRCRI